MYSWKWTLSICLNVWKGPKVCRQTSRSVFVLVWHRDIKREAGSFLPLKQPIRSLKWFWLCDAVLRSEALWGLKFFGEIFSHLSFLPFMKSNDYFCLTQHCSYLCMWLVFLFIYLFIYLVIIIICLFRFVSIFILACFLY